MDKVNGKPLRETWFDMEYDSQLCITKLAASWTKKLASIQSNKIGGIYMRSSGRFLEFCAGPSVHPTLIQDYRRLFDIDRGLYNTLQDWYSAVLDAADKELGVLLENIRAITCKKDDELGLDSFPFSYSSTHCCSQGASSAETIEDPIFRLSRETDEENKEWRTFTIRSLLTYQAAVLSLQAAVLQLCERSPKTSGSLSTMLSHHDISLQNILVDDLGKPVASCILMTMHA